MEKKNGVERGKGFPKKRTIRTDHPLQDYSKKLGRHESREFAVKLSKHWDFSRKKSYFTLEYQSKNAGGPKPPLSNKRH